MDTAELFELGKRLGLSGDDLEHWVLEEQRYWREEKALELESLKKIAEMEKARAAIEKERDEHVRAREKIEKETLQLHLRLAELQGPPLSEGKGETLNRAQMEASPFSAREFLEPSCSDDRKVALHDILPVDRSSVQKSVPIRDSEVQQPHSFTQSPQKGSNSKHPPTKLSCFFSPPEGHRSEIKKTVRRSARRPKLKPNCLQKDATGWQRSFRESFSGNYHEFPPLVIACGCGNILSRATHIYRNGRGLHRSHCRKRHKLPAGLPFRMMSGLCMPLVCSV